MMTDLPSPYLNSRHKTTHIYFLLEAITEEFKIFSAVTSMSCNAAMVRGACMVSVVIKLYYCIWCLSHLITCHCFSVSPEIFQFNIKYHMVTHESEAIRSC